MKNREVTNIVIRNKIGTLLTSFYLLLFLTGVQLFYNVVLVSNIKQGGVEFTHILCTLKYREYKKNVCH